ncbi:MAG: hypothetical protein ACKOJF_11445, partial [Planctomycetaceae bacterium]
MARKTAGKQALPASATPTASLHAADLRAVLPVLGALAGGKTPHIDVQIGSGGWQIRATDGSSRLVARGDVVQVETGLHVCLSP